MLSWFRSDNLLYFEYIWMIEFFHNFDFPYCSNRKAIFFFVHEHTLQSKESLLLTHTAFKHLSKSTFTNDLSLIIGINISKFHFCKRFSLVIEPRTQCLLHWYFAGALLLFFFLSSLSSGRLPLSLLLFRNVCNRLVS